VYKASKTDLTQADGHIQFQSGYFYNYGITVSTGNELTISGHDIKPWRNGDSFDITIDNSQKQNQNS
jgi:inorganic pyrophosphatase